MVVRAFTVEIISSSIKIGLVYCREVWNRIQCTKKHMNVQIIVYAKVVLHPKYCSVVLGLNVVAWAQVLGNTVPDYPLCVYKDKDGVQYLIGPYVTNYI